jgi:DNA-binding transcriptional LysR family regulator
MKPESPGMRFNQIDLNLFVLFDTIYNERNLTRAAEVLHLTQPAVSNALTRLRKSLGDPLFVRTPQGMVPTPAAQNMIGQVREALKRLDTCIQERDIFDPARSDRIFNISVRYLGEVLLLPSLLHHIQKMAPGISLQSRDMPRLDAATEMAAGNLDIALDTPLMAHPQLNSQLLLKDDFVCVTRRGHPVSGKPLTMPDYLKLSHIHVSSRKKGLGYVDLALQALGQKRRLALRTQHYIAVPHILARSDLAISINRKIAEHWDADIHELPFDVPEFEFNLYWHKSADQDHANRWLRQKVSEFVRAS